MFWIYLHTHGHSGYVAGPYRSTHEAVLVANYLNHHARQRAYHVVKGHHVPVNHHHRRS
jgi:glycine cleavage system protein P-like pyridoxal-binding family